MRRAFSGRITLINKACVSLTSESKEISKLLQIFTLSKTQNVA